MDQLAEESLDERLARARRGSRWRKVPDTRLGLCVAGTLRIRVERGISAASTEQPRIEKVRRNTEVVGPSLGSKWG